MRLNRSIVIALVACAGVLCLASPQPTFAQRRGKADGPALERVHNTRQEWTVRIEYSLHHLSTASRGMRCTTPLCGNTAMSEARPELLTGWMRVMNRQVDSSVEIVPDLPVMSEAAVLEAEFSPLRDGGLTMQLDVSSVAYETRIDERKARSREWPDAPWSNELNTCLEPQRWVESDSDAVRRLVDAWTNGNPRRAKPYDLAKYLASKVISHVNVGEMRFEQAAPAMDESGMRASMVVEFNVNGAEHAAARGTGSQYDLACLLVAVYRAAGIPARLVIGVDVELAPKELLPPVHAWVEFFLPENRVRAESDIGDPAPVEDSQGEWIPVDVWYQKQFASRAPDINRRWPYFGNHEDAEMLAPFSHHWFPPNEGQGMGEMPATIVAMQGVGGPVQAFMEIRYNVTGTPRRGGR